jgi:hypothetical protein
MGADAETEFRILIDHLTIGCLVVDVAGDKPFIFKDLLNEFAYLFPARRSRLGFQNPTALRSKRIEGSWHD